MNECIINPWVLYFILHAHNMCLGIAIMTLLAQPFFMFTIYDSNEEAEELWQRHQYSYDGMAEEQECKYNELKNVADFYKKLQRISFVITLMAALCATFIPNKEDSLAIYLASKIDKNTSAEIYRDIKTEILSIIKEGASIVKEVK